MQSSEQYTPPQPEQASWYGQETYVSESQAHDDETPLEVARARRAAAAAFSAIPSGVLEAVPVSAEKLHQAQLHEVSAIGTFLVRFRRAYQENNFDLGKDGDDEVRMDMFSQPAPAPRREDAVFNLNEDDELDPDLFSKKVA